MATTGMQKRDRVLLGQEQAAGCVGTGTPERWLWRHRGHMRAGVTLGCCWLGGSRGGVSEAIAGITRSFLVVILKTETEKLGKELQNWLHTWDPALERLSLKVYQLCRWVTSQMGEVVFRSAKTECDQRSGTGNSDQVVLQTECDF